MNMAELHLNDEETSAFITLWEQFPQLWNPQDKKYKNREARNLALRQIADLFSKNWTTGKPQEKNRFHRLSRQLLLYIFLYSLIIV